MGSESVGCAGLVPGGLADSTLVSARGKPRLKTLNLVHKTGRRLVAPGEPFQNEISSSIVSTKVFGLGDCAASPIHASSLDGLRFA